MSNIDELERRVIQLESFYTDIPEMVNLRLDRNDAAHAEHSARLNIIDKQLAALTREVRDMRGGVTRQLTGQDQRLAAVLNRLEALEKRLEAIDKRLEALEKRLEAIDRRLEAVEDRQAATEKWQAATDRRLEGIDAQLARVITILETKLP